MCRIYETRYEFMLSELRHLQTHVDIDWQTPTGGMSIWVNIFKDSKRISDLAKKKGVLFQYESAMDSIKSIGTHLRIGFAVASEKEIKEGVEVLRSLL